MNKICWPRNASNLAKSGRALLSCFFFFFLASSTESFWMVVEVSDLCRLFLQSSLLIFRVHQFLLSDEKLFVERVSFLLSLKEKEQSVLTCTRGHRHVWMLQTAKARPTMRTNLKVTYVVQVFPQGDLTADQLVSQIVIFLFQAHVSVL